MGLLYTAAVAGISALASHRAEPSLATTYPSTTFEASAAAVAPTELSATLATTPHSAALANTSAVRLHGPARAQLSFLRGA